MRPDQTILLATDLSEGALDGYTFAAALARTFQSPLHALHVRVGEDPAIGTALIPESARAHHQGPVVECVREAASPAMVARRIVEYAATEGAGLVVIGARGNGGRRRPLLGEVAQTVVREAPCSVLTARGRMPLRGLRRILVPVDFSSRSAASLRTAMKLGEPLGAQVDVLHVVVPELPSYTVFPSARPAPEVATRWGEVLEQFVAEQRLSAPEPALHVRVGHPATTILNFALERTADLVVISASGEGATELGSVARGVGHSSICSTLTVRADAFSDEPRATQARLDTSPEPERPAHHRYGDASRARRLRKLT